MIGRDWGGKFSSFAPPTHMYSEGMSLSKQSLRWIGELWIVVNTTIGNLKLVAFLFSPWISWLLGLGRLHWISELWLAVNSRYGNLIVRPFQVLHLVCWFGYCWGYIGVWFGAERWIDCRSITSQKWKSIRCRWGCLMSVAWILYCFSLSSALTMILALKLPVQCSGVKCQQSKGQCLSNTMPKPNSPMTPVDEILQGPVLRSWDLGTRK